MGKLTMELDTLSLAWELDMIINKGSSSSKPKKQETIDSQWYLHEWTMDQHHLDPKLNWEQLLANTKCKNKRPFKTQHTTTSIFSDIAMTTSRRWYWR